MANTNPLPIEALESDLMHAEGELKKATEHKLQAMDVETQWQTEVTSLRNLIEVRKKRLLPVSRNGSSGDAVAEIGGIQATPVTPERISHINWIDRAITNSGILGMSPPEILRAAANVGIKMHKNYPYIVLGQLVERGKAVKREGRYYPNTG